MYNSITTNNSWQNRFWMGQKKSNPLVLQYKWDMLWYNLHDLRSFTYILHTNTDFTYMKWNTFFYFVLNFTQKNYTKCTFDCTKCTFDWQLNKINNCVSRAWCKTIVTPYIKWGSYNSFAPSPRYVCCCFFSSDN